MTKLPTTAALGPRETPVSQRAIVTVRSPGELERASQETALQTARFAGEIGQLARDRLDRMDRLDYATANSTFLQAKAEADTEFAQDPDYSTAPQRYQERLEEIRKATSATIRNNQTRKLFDQSIKADISQGKTRISSLAFGRERDAGREHISGLISTNQQAALNATDPYTANSILTATREAVQGATDKGYFSKQEAGKLNRAFAESYAEGRVGLMPASQRVDALRAGMIEGEEGMAFEKTGTFVDFLSVDRRMNMLQNAEAAMTREYAQADKIAKENAKALSDKISKEGATMAAQGQLTPEWVMERADGLGLSSYRTLLKAATSDEAIADDRVLVADLYRNISDSIDITDMAINAYAERNLTRSTMNTILSRNDTMQGKAAPGTAYQRSSAYLKNALRPSQLNDNPDAAAAYANAEADLQTYFDENPQATISEGMERSKSIAGAYRLAPQTVLSLPFRDWMVGDRAMRKPDLDATEAQIALDLKNGVINRDTALRRAKDVREWRQFEGLDAQ